VDRARLTAERELISHQVDALTEDFGAIVASTDLVSTDDEHDPDGATIAFERAMVAALLQQARRQRDELDAALARLAADSYGRCGSCGGEIAPARLEALPATTVCITCAPGAPTPGGIGT
jgi:RNA polymerase-binding transcription factor DksA